MTDIWLPKVAPMVSEERWAKMSRAGRLAIGSSYVIHLSADGGQQVLFMKFQDMPEILNIGSEIGVHASGPMLWGLSCEFHMSPAIYRDGGDSPNNKGRGSQFVVGALVYNVSSVETHHGGTIKLGLTHAKSCNVREMQFFDDVRPYVCLDELS